MFVALEIGPGTADGRSKVIPGAYTVDVGASGADCQAVWGRDEFPWPDNSYDLIFASHVLEHVPWYRTDAALSEVYRLLKPGGKFEVYVPDFAFIVKQYQKQEAGDNWEVYDIKDHWMTWINGRLFTYGEDAVELASERRPLQSTHHKAVFDAGYLEWRLKRNGFKTAVKWKRKHGHPHPNELGMMAIK